MGGGGGASFFMKPNRISWVSTFVRLPALFKARLYSDSAPEKHRSVRNILTLHAVSSFPWVQAAPPPFMDKGLTLADGWPFSLRAHFLKFFFLSILSKGTHTLGSMNGEKKKSIVLITPFQKVAE